MVTLLNTLSLIYTPNIFLFILHSRKGNNVDKLQRAYATLAGLALGDALGMPTQSMSPNQIRDSYGGPVSGLRSSGEDQPIAPLMQAGSVTDDTEQAVLLAELLIEDKGRIDPPKLARRLLDWEAKMETNGSLDLLGPSTKLALQQLRDGVPMENLGTTGTTNGAAMRVAPIGVACALESPRLFDLVFDSCRLTHRTVNGIQAATVVALSVSAGIEGYSITDAIQYSLGQITDRELGGVWNPQALVASRIEYALEVSQLHNGSESSFITSVQKEIGTSVEANESIPAAFALLHYYRENPYQALIAATNIGGDTDTIGAIVGAIIGATCGSTVFPHDEVSLVENVSGINFLDLAQSLVELRMNHA